jgi:hypothetical protein
VDASAFLPSTTRPAADNIAGALTMSPALRSLPLGRGENQPPRGGQRDAPSRQVFSARPTRRRTTTSRGCRSAPAAAS